MPRTIGRTADNPSHVRLSRRNLLNLAIFLVLLYVLVPQLGKFRSSLGVIRHARPGWVAAALAFAMATYLLAAALYWLLAKKRLRYGRTLAVQIASMFANRLLPAGIGAISVNYEYLHKNKHTRPEVAAVVAANTLGFLGHMVLVGCTVLVTRQPFKHLELPHLKAISYWIVLGLVVAVLVLVWFKKLRHWLLGMVHSTLRNLAGYRTHPLRVLLALLSSMALTSLYVLCLLACTQAVGAHLSFPQVLIVLTVGVIGGTVAPTPGGLVRAEAGLVAGLVADGLAGADALAITLLYRLLTYWLALLGGAVAFAAVRQRGYV